MSVSITLHDELAAQLQAQAAASQLSLEQFALQVLRDAATNPHARWQASNQRRVALIGQHFADGLSAGEREELERLQLQADQHVEEMDDRMLDDVRQLQNRLSGLREREKSKTDVREN